MYFRYFLFIFLASLYFAERIHQLGTVAEKRLRIPGRSVGAAERRADGGTARAAKPPAQSPGWTVVLSPL